MNEYAHYLLANIADLVIILAGLVFACWLVTPRKKGRH